MEEKNKPLMVRNKFLVIICLVLLVFAYIISCFSKSSNSETELTSESNIENVYYGDTKMNFDELETEIQESNAQKEAEIKEVLKEFLGQFHTYCYLDNSYMLKMVSDFASPSCLYHYLMSRMDGKVAWETDDELMAYLEDYEPNRGDYITSPKLVYHVSEISIVVDWDKSSSENYKVYTEYLLAEKDTTDSGAANYSRHMASLYVKLIDGQWKVSSIRYISEGGIVGEYGIE